MSSLLPKGKVKVVQKLPCYTYIGTIIGRDKDFIYLDTSEDYEGIITLPINNLVRIIKYKSSYITRSTDEL